MNILSLRHIPTFLYTYLQLAIEQGLVTMEYPQNPNHPKQRYCLTEKGKNISF
jgi:ATP-dependent DNA helicase RecG